MTTALLLIDLQNDYLDTRANACWPLEGCQQAVDTAQSILTAVRRQGWPVIHVRHESQRPNAAFFVPGTEGARIVSALQPLANETVITKHFPNSFRDTSLHETLQSQGITELIVVGAMTHMCIDASLRAALDLGYSCTLITDACATRALEHNGVRVEATQVQATLLAAFGFIGVQLQSSQQWLAANPYNNG